jgi:AraC-like DNA-binding protein/mannose-6-phosphate isomerase-like protein (cupin superfamily)
MNALIQKTENILHDWSARLLDGSVRVHLAKSQPHVSPSPRQHAHEYTEIFLQISGRNHFTLPGKKLILQEGECLLMPLGVPHAEVAKDGENPFRMLVLGLAPWQCTFIHGTRGHSPAPVVDQVFCTPNRHPRAMKDLISATERYLSSEGSVKTGARLMGILLQEYANHLDLPATHAWKLGKQDLSAKATQMVQARFRQTDCNVATIARELGVTPNYLSAQYRAQTGKRLSDHILEERLNLARRLLEETDLKMITIAARCGFSDPSPFIARFKAHTGYTPLQYAKQHQA